LSFKGQEQALRNLVKYCTSLFVGLLAIV